MLPTMPPAQPLTVGLFVTCLVDVMRPAVGFAALKLLKAAGCRVVVPEAQTCCGQPAYNSGDDADARAIARRVMDAFEGVDYVVAPSGSCAGMIRVHYPALFKDDPLSAAAEELAGRTYELTSFLSDVMQWTEIDAEYDGRVTYQDGCAGLRELAVRDQPRKLLALVRGLELVEGINAETCCGFGGLFSLKYPAISTRIADDKGNDIGATGADLVLGGDLGCLIHLAGRMARRGTPVSCRHVAEVLAGMTTDAPPMGGLDEKKNTR
jgi:L-lactate dehydrogenase complex protein LldE